MTHALVRLTTATWLGINAALRVPRLVSGDAMGSLVKAPPFRTFAEQPDRETALATGIAFAVLRQLSRLPGTRWRNTCLFRAAAECWILRSRGFPAVLRIGVARDIAPLAATHPRATGVETPRSAAGPHIPGHVAAHAWVECASVPCRTALGGERDNYVLLESPG
ncbi:MAG: lasso peptide biosynthesis protein [Gemmatimonadaceae bacterium]